MEVKWLPFSLVGGVLDMFPKGTPSGGVLNGFSYAFMTTLHPVAMSDQVVYSTCVLARAFAPIKNECIGSFNSQPLISC